eukprot:CAMPEP_0174311264 /NCGR_PEP_ID=MMETSP0810-20121108/3610_1 /TAXON_ID=73025 ORGANISM="Eutreptiella gymnastica-like, Strain CCMP1594" /NCGR_SAMPLE_ID=MMETSP0810 /ASSEMBLY_ACC=CAM_ASM_000659 /LENGTH=158 /DNA_ID=CAMNT_0015419471 /DNA_START=22 /DNA_END=500 /DNA_ORIENTATION=+
MYPAAAVFENTGGDHNAQAPPAIVVAELLSDAVRQGPPPQGDHFKLYMSGYPLPPKGLWRTSVGGGGGVGVVYQPEKFLPAHPSNFNPWVSVGSFGSQLFLSGALPRNLQLRLCRCCPPTPQPQPSSGMGHMCPWDMSHMGSGEYHCVGKMSCGFGPW